MQDRIEKTVELRAPVARVWKALTDHREFGQWFRVSLNGPFVVGEIVTGQMTYPGYEHLPFEARIEAIEPEHYFSMSWCPYACDAGVDYSSEPQTLVEFRLEPTETGSRLVVTESGFDARPDKKKRVDAIRSNTQGWDIQSGHIAAHVES